MNTDVIHNYAFCGDMIITLAFETVDWFFLIFGDWDLFVTDYQAVKYGIVHSVGAIEGDV
jgi:hypothetical protein